MWKTSVVFNSFNIRVQDNSKKKSLQSYVVVRERCVVVKCKHVVGKVFTGCLSPAKSLCHLQLVHVS